MTDEIKNRLLTMSDNQYGAFSTNIIPNAKNIVGVRIPKLRQYAKELAKTLGENSLVGEDDFYYEEIMLRGMIIGYMKVDTDKRLVYIKEFIPKIDNWGICDSFCSTLKFADKNRERVWKFLQSYIHSDREFEQRFGAVMLLDYFVNDEYIDRTLTALSEINTEQYYSSMAVAWALAECYIKFPEKALPFIRQSDTDTLKRTIRKICDSYRVDGDTKKQLKKEFWHDKRNG